MKTICLKKLLHCLLTGILLFSLSACGQPTQSQPSSSSAAPPQSSSSTSSLDMSDSSSSASNTSSITPTEDATTGAGDGALIIYFSATSNTKAVAQTIAETTSGDLYEIIPNELYTDADLNWRDESTRVNVEHNDPAFRPAIAGDLPDLSTFDTVFIGYPSWWGEAPNIVWTLVEGIDFAGKTVIPFCTSSSSGLGSSGKTLEAMTSGATWLEGQRFRSGADAADVVAWVNGLNI